MRFFLVLGIAAYCIYQANGYIVEPGPVVIATKGEVWPKPFAQEKLDKYSILYKDSLQFQIIGQTCAILSGAIARYSRIIKKHLNSLPDKSSHAVHHDNKLFQGNFSVVKINLTNACDEVIPTNMIESYHLNVEQNSANLLSESIWGILRGLETFSQLLFESPDENGLQINDTQIYDEPRYSYRGLLVDTSRHYIHPTVLKRILNGMEYNKLNVFHWHIVDDHSFPYESRVFPELSERGAFRKDMTYSRQVLDEIIEYARARGIRVIAEFDTPGHTRSWGVSHPEILTACEGVFQGKFGPIDPSNEDVYTFMEELLNEIAHVFPDEYIHLGGDEVGFECWESSRRIKEHMSKNNITSYPQLEEVYIQRIVDIVKQLKRKSIVWQEVFQNGVTLTSDTIVQVWTGNRQKLLSQITEKGLSAILSTCWYLDHLSTGGDWRKFYSCEPSSFPGTAAQQKLLIGGTACMWAESVDDTNILQRIFPRVSATAEKLWSQESVRDIIEAERRLEEHACRLIGRHIPAQPPNGPGFC